MRTPPAPPRRLLGGGLSPQRIAIKVATQSADGVTLEVAIAVRYRAPAHYAVLPANAEESFFEFSDAQEQISGAIAAAVCACAPKLRFEELNQKHNELASAVLSQLRPVMDGLGYELLTARVVRVTALHHTHC
jgi:hypothetical protein